MTRHTLPLKSHFLVYGALLALTFSTVAAARIDLGPLNVVIALTIAMTKAVLVGLFFMHLLYTAGRTKVTVVAGLLWLIILIALTLSDVLTRGWLPLPSGL